ncbi:hypothetical protein [uncultured Caulobacter sp.]|nr:hypothetical protein [uncultured Caulobacter sp.]
MRSSPRAAKAAATEVLFRSRAMLAIGVIAIFLLVFMGLNASEFGRID